MFMRLYLAAVLAIGLSLGSTAVPDRASAAVTDLSTDNTRPAEEASVNPEYMQLAQRGRGGGRGGARSRGARPSGGRNVNRNTNRNTNRNVNRNTNRNVNRNVNVNVRTRGHGWRGARWGAVAFGVTMGTAIVVAANTPPYPPDDSLCWTWTNAGLTRGYWYYCDGL